MSENIRDLIYKVVRRSSKEMNDSEIHHFVSGILVGLAMVEKDSLRCLGINRELRTLWKFDPSTPSADYGPDTMASALLRAMPGEELILPI